MIHSGSRGLGHKYAEHSRKLEQNTSERASMVGMEEYDFT